MSHDRRFDMSFYAVIMAGGKGERFWPKSRINRPKQLLAITGKDTMLQKTVYRLKQGTDNKKIYIITNELYKNEIGKQLPSLIKNNIVAEPVGRNTAPCIGYAALLVQKKDPEGVMVVLPADHEIGNKGKFLQVIKGAVSTAKQENCLITIGVVPDFPSTGYGYIQKGKVITKAGQVVFNRVENFKEKPNEKKAKEYLKSGRYLWNSGMFVWKANVILEEIKKYMPKLYKDLEQLNKAIAKKDKAQIAAVYKRMDNVSIDYGIMEKSKRVLVTGGDFGWDDVGSWSAIERHLLKDKNNNVKIGKVESIDSENCIIFGENDTIITTVGVSDLIVIKDGDAVLICDKKRDQDVKLILKDLKNKACYKKYL